VTDWRSFAENCSFAAKTDKNWNYDDRVAAQLGANAMVKLFCNFSQIFCDFRQFAAIFFQFAAIFAYFLRFFSNFLRFSPIFCDFRQFSAKKWHFSLKARVMIQILKNNSRNLIKNVNFFANFFAKILQKSPHRFQEEKQKSKNSAFVLRLAQSS
jgi:hypothetical protein